ncbi:MAG TPA: PVC-type heme-binding CxxCH protein, partial [Chthoniobacteraceae bacterium]
MTIRFLPLATAVACCARLAFAGNATDAKPVSPEEELKSFETDSGLRVELVAGDPLVASPCAMAFDERGRLFVAEDRGYPIGPKPGQPPDGDIVLLEDTDGNGRMDKRTVYADGLTFPDGVLPWQGGVIVTCAPDVLFLKDSKGDGHADIRKVLLTGFDTTKSTQLRVNCPILGPDGWIYFASGYTGGTISSPEHPEYPPVKMKGDLRWNPVTGEFQNVDGKSEYGISFDRFENRFICMNRIQVQHVVLSSQALRRNPSLAFSETVQNCPDLLDNTFLPGHNGAARVYPISSNITTADSHAGTFTAACGVYIWPGGALPNKYRDCAFSCEPTGNLVHVDRLVRKESSFAAVPLLKEKDVLASRDDWCRPVFLTNGPDGALYVCDMYRRVIEHPDYLAVEIRKHLDFDAGKDLGRIWRVCSAEGAMKPVDFGKAGPEELAEHLLDENRWAAETARRLLLSNFRSQTPPVAIKPHDATTAADPRWFRVRQLLSPLTDAELSEAFRSKAPGAQAAALAILNEDLAAGRRDATMLAPLGVGPAAEWKFDPLHYALALGGLHNDAVAIPLLAKAAVWDAPDHWKNAAVVSSAKDRELPLLQAILQTPEMRTAPDSLTSFVSLLVETLGRADARHHADSLETVLKLVENQSYPNRAAIGGAYAHGSGKQMDPAGEKVAALLEETRGILSSRKLPAAAAIPVLAHTPWSVGGEKLLELGASGDQAALQALAAFDEPEIPRKLLTKEIWLHASPQTHIDLVLLCLARPSFHAAVLDAIESGAIPASALLTQQKQKLRESKIPEVRSRAEKLLEAATGDRMKTFEESKACLALTGHAAHGHDVFRANCTVCHRLDREGVAVGPDLLDIRNQTKETILLQIVIPEYEIAPGFAAYFVETRDGRSLAGILTSETPESVTLRQPGG